MREKWLIWSNPAGKIWLAPRDDGFVDVAVTVDGSDITVATCIGSPDTRSSEGSARIFADCLVQMVKRESML